MELYKLKKNLLFSVPVFRYISVYEISNMNMYFLDFNLPCICALFFGRPFEVILQKDIFGVFLGI